MGLKEDGTTAIPPFLCVNTKNTGATNKKAFSKNLDHNDVIEFAKSAIAGLKDAMQGDLLLGPVLRVDVMLYQPADGPARFVVNEFESLEALISASGRQAAIIDAQVHTFLVEFWNRQIIDAIMAETSNRREEGMRHYLKLTSV